MFDSAIDTMLAQALAELPAIVIEKTLSHDLDELVAQVFPSCRVAVVSDHHTFAALGERICKALTSRFSVSSVMLADKVSADIHTVEYLKNSTHNADVLIAVGSGTINDLCKYVSAQTRRPYAVFATAASMNGYLSANASISDAHHKKTFAAMLPRAVWCDLEVIAAAPLRLTQSGLGDSVARPTAQADWLLSHVVLGTAYTPLPFDVLKSHESQLFAQARGIALQDPATLRLLMELLLLSGLGMTIAGGSYPASQGEHMIAHAYGMAYGSDCLHGEEIAVTTLTMARLQEDLLRRDTIALRPNDFDIKKMTALYGAQVAQESQDAFEKKYALYAHADTDWHAIAERITAITLSAAHIERILQAAECPVHPLQLGWDQAAYQQVVATARYTRDRFTFMDVD